MKYISFFVMCVLLLTQQMSAAQGCSDAGFCSIGNLAAQGQTKKSGKKTLKLLLPIGVGDEDVFVFTPSLEYNQQVSNRVYLQGKITANAAAGNLGSTFAAGDVFLSATYGLAPDKTWRPSLTLGTKLPLNQSNLKENGLPLPMQYQSSLGTIDLIAGISITSPHWQFAAGYQQPLSGRNRNQFLPQYWNKPEAAAYAPSNDFDRKGDLLLRTAYRVQKRSASLNFGLLGIYHLGEDKFINANISNKAIPIEGSAGLTLNATMLLRVPVNKRWELGITGGIPLVVRDVRPDGLTRSFVLAPQIIYTF